MRSRWTWLAAVCLPAVVLLAGCNQEQGAKLDDAFDEAKKAAEDALTGEEQATGDGQIELQAAAPVKTRACYVRFTKASDGRAVLRITSYREPSDETPPSVMLQARVEADSVEALAGQQAQAEVYVSSDGGTTVWHTPPGQPAEVQISSVANGKLTARIVRGTLVNATTGEQINLSGQLEGTLL